MIEKYVVTQIFPHAGDWLVHLPALNRQAVARCNTREQAERVAEALNGVADAVAAEREACAQIAFQALRESAGTWQGTSAELIMIRIRARGEREAEENRDDTSQNS